MREGRKKTGGAGPTRAPPSPPPRRLASFSGGIAVLVSQFQAPLPRAAPRARAGSAAAMVW